MKGRAKGMNKGTGRKRVAQPNRYGAGLRRARDAEEKAREEGWASPEDRREAEEEFDRLQQFLEEK